MTRKTAIETVLAVMADEHLATMANVGWANASESLRKGGHGETFGCEVDGVYCDIGDSIEWVAHPGGPIRLRVVAQAKGKSAERSTILSESS
jgi:hypothetical protein